jgi:hypothetical protein
MTTGNEHTWTPNKNKNGLRPCAEQKLYVFIKNSIRKTLQTQQKTIIWNINPVYELSIIKPTINYVF